MTKDKQGRQQVRPVEQTSILDKQFKRVLPVSKRMNKPKIHPVMVIADLRKGSLVSLDRYLAQEGGIPDRGVALELRKLISGSVCRTRFRVLVIDHPGKPKSVGGRPRKAGRRSSKKDREIALAYETALPQAGKVYGAVKYVADERKTSEASVRRALKAVRGELIDAEEKERREAQRQQSSAEAVELREGALANLRARRGRLSKDADS